MRCRHPHGLGPRLADSVLPCPPGGGSRQPSCRQPGASGLAGLDHTSWGGVAGAAHGVGGDSCTPGPAAGGEEVGVRVRSVQTTLSVCAHHPHNEGEGAEPRGGNSLREVQRGTVGAPGPPPGLTWPHQGEGLSEKAPPCSRASAVEERGRHWPFPSRGHLAGRVGGRGDKGADVGDASTPIMEAGPTHPVGLGWLAPLRQEAPLPQAPRP